MGHMERAPKTIFLDGNVTQAPDNPIGALKADLQICFQWICVLCHFTLSSSHFWSLQHIQSSPKGHAEADVAHRSMQVHNSFPSSPDTGNQQKALTVKPLLN